MTMATMTGTIADLRMTWARYQSLRAAALSLITLGYRDLATTVAADAVALGRTSFYVPVPRLVMGAGSSSATSRNTAEAGRRPRESAARWAPTIVRHSVCP
jgi:hypothetical protein